MSRLTQDGTVKPVSRDQIIRRERGQGNIHSLCSADHKQVWQSYPVDPYSDDFTYILYLPVHTSVPVHVYYMYHECSSRAYIFTICTVHSYHDTASAALLSSPVISTNEDQRIQQKCPRPGNTTVLPGCNNMSARICRGGSLKKNKRGISLTPLGYSSTCVLELLVMESL